MSSRSRAASSSASVPNEQSVIVHNIVEVADLYHAFRLGGPKLGGFTSEQTLTFLRTQAATVISIGMLETRAAVVPDWERRRANDPRLQRLLVETALESP